MAADLAVRRAGDPVTSSDRRPAWEPTEEDIAFYDVYGDWDPLTPSELARLMTGFPRPWWLVGGHAIEAFTGVPRHHEDIDLAILTTDFPLLRAQLAKRRLMDSRTLQDRPHGSGARVAGLVTQRQRPATAKGTIFVTLEDEHGMVNVIVWPHLAIRRRKALLQSRLLAVRGRWERVDGVQHLIAGREESGLEHLIEMLRRDRQFEDGLARRTLIDAFRVVQDEDLVGRYRRRMSSLLF